MKRFFNWLADKISPEAKSPRADLSRTGQHAVKKKPAKPAKQAVPRSQPEYIDFDSSVDGEIDSVGPGKNVLRRKKYVREDTGTHESLSILDGAIEDDRSDEDGIDPYNTGQFDRSKNWDKRFRKD
jgi:hypothetical protein